MKKAELILTQAWQRQASWLIGLAPLSWLYHAISRLRKWLYQSGKLPVYRASVPVLVVGNITVGGSGKTPLIIALVEYLLTQGVQVAVISRGYGGDTKTMPRLVLPTSTPHEVGDEPCLIVQSLAAKGHMLPMAVGANRAATIDLLLASFPHIRLIVSDDGLQHYALARDEEWIVVDMMRGFGNGKLLPQGFLREPINRLEGAMVVYHHANKTKPASDNQPTMVLQAGKLVALQPSNQPPPQVGSAVYAVSGIGYPARFFRTLTELGFDVVERPFGDHHDFTIDDLMGLDKLPIITTSKDAVKLRLLAQGNPLPIFANIWVLSVEAKLSQAVYQAADLLMTKYCPTSPLDEMVHEY
ncbi:lipid-A-disaccharide kinase [Moraxella cuniculi DSM 21768]|uniref:Tetraacyldisaccharide 4'-kinase n=1 Tax=Moraxella cuniculi DSM 21768 TaxID=1122245 RepID=A0A1N7EPH4_9GAMM|nr:tetraacyldisaccharide 4'-kinase [Moraxella cuniculi]OOS07694.1 tetraacyldisaccharide 4'-kinase [Moraxella cuniculi]SIR89988.1 lipid-A-disaccharide kinase [Moraxella cuniculi DSM 21768]